MVEQQSLLQERDSMTEGEKKEALGVLAESLQRIKTVDAQIADTTDSQVRAQGYEERYGLVLLALATAWMCGLQVGFRLDEAEPNRFDPEPPGSRWPVVYIELPTGQVSWHMPPHPRDWDGHPTDEKYRRIDAFVEQQGF